MFNTTKIQVIDKAGKAVFSGTIAQKNMVGTMVLEMARLGHIVRVRRDKADGWHYWRSIDGTVAKMPVETNIIRLSFVSAGYDG